jgi:alpha,alpha-trehalose phosphorylase
VAVVGFGGMRDNGEMLAFAPRLPDALTRLAFRLEYRGRRLRVEVRRGRARYELVSGDSLEVFHHGTPIQLRQGEPLEVPSPEPPAIPPVHPPHGREPGRHGVGANGTDHHKAAAPAT